MGKKKAKRGKVKQRAVSVATIAGRKRRHLVEQQLLQGQVSQTLIAAAHGVTQQTISNDIKAIAAQWLQEDIEETKAGRRQSVRRQEAIMARAAISFERSTQTSSEITIAKKICPLCKGEPDGDSKGQCPECLGQGRILIETTKLISKPGDAKHLMVMHACEKEIARLKGLHKQHPKEKESGGNTYNVLINGEGGNLAEKYADVSTDMIIAARTAVANLEQAIKNGKSGDNNGGLVGKGAIIEGSVVTSKSNDDKENQDDEENHKEDD